MMPNHFRRSVMHGLSDAGVDPGQFYIVELTIALTALQALNNQSATLPNNRPFKWMFAAAVSTGTFTALITDGASGYQFSNQQVHRDNMWGTAQNPMPLITPYIFKRQIQVAITDLSNAVNSVRLAFIGVELGEPGR